MYKKLLLLLLLPFATAIESYAQVSNEICFVSPTVPDIVNAKIEWTFNPGATITIRTTFSKTFVDNTYGTNAIGWGSRGHTFNNLVGSDNLQLALLDAKGVKKLEFKIDYITASSTVPSGFRTLGVTGGEGKMLLGSATSVVGAKTSISENLNTFGYVLTTNSPATNATYTPNPAFPNWIYDVWYEVTVSAAAFGADGFGSPLITGVHASPSKTGKNTEIVIPGPCPPGKKLCLGNLVWNDRNGSGIKDADEPPIAGITVSLFKDANNDNLPDGAAIRTTVTDAKGNYLFCDLEEGRYITCIPILPGYGPSPNTLSGLTSPNPNNDIDNDNNAIRKVGDKLFTNAITLNFNSEPTNDGDGSNGNLTLDLAICGNTNIGDFVWCDNNADGIQDPGEPGIKAVKVTLMFPDGTIAMTQTDNNGIYHFYSLGPGTHKLIFGMPPGKYPSPANKGNDEKDSDPIGNVVMVTVPANNPPNTFNNSYDAGFTDKTDPSCINVSLGSKIYFDKNEGDIRNYKEKGLAGLTVNLYRDGDANNVPDGPAIAFVVTDIDGDYLFSNLVQGNYIVGVVVKDTKYALQSVGTPNANNDVDGDNNGVNAAGGEVRTNHITLIAGTEPTNDGSDNNTNKTLDIGLGEYKMKGANVAIPVTQLEITDESPTMKVFPNPARNYVTLNVNSPVSGNATVRIIDVNGKLIMVNNTRVNTGANTININNISKLKSGSYQVQLIMGNTKLNNTLLLAK